MARQGFRRGAPKKLFIGALVLLAFLGAFAFLGADRSVPSAAMPALADDASPQQRGAAVFVGGGFGGISQDALETNAIPWKLAAAALVLDHRRTDPKAKIDQATLRKIMQQFGFLYPERLTGMPDGLATRFDSKPLGLTHGTIAPVGGARVEVANIGCAACHAGIAYDRGGNPMPQIAAPGMPNTSLDLEQYTSAIFEALRNEDDDGALLDAAATLFPEMGWREKASLRFIVLPLARQRLAQLAGEERAMPFPNGLPGATNGVAALKQQIRSPMLNGGPGEAGFVSIPELALRDRRSRLLSDGAYAAPGGKPDASELAAITSFFTVPSMGIHPDVARSHEGDAMAVFAWLAEYRPLRFPGPFDEARARRGMAVFEAQCASCHGSYEWSAATPQLKDFPDWVGDVGTDPLRADAFDAALARKVAGTSYAQTIEVRNGEGYAAPPLAGLWASAPYLHNGSVQSLEALLDPSKRLPRFMVGGHALDWETVGLRVDTSGRYPAGYRPFSRPQWVDTRQPGLGNTGHEYGKELSEEERRALLEFLKAL
ncbi:hypothetical protein [Erythrobacter sp. HKB08]|uniref:c-type cytochrome n=1 Tax=Erythrobacter sp. HKB08 TaxID=2502843 RepID=UPI001008B806|nr:hypothetical protein [Erythrobacter sp. HKB08]